MFVSAHEVWVHYLRAIDDAAFIFTTDVQTLHWSVVKLGIAARQSFQALDALRDVYP
jgi:hypothetical protein